MAVQLGSPSLPGGRFLVGVAFVLSAFAAGVSAQATPEPKSMDFTSSPRGHVLVRASIDGSEPLVFALDTAAQKSFITPDVAQRLALEQVDHEQVTTLGVHGLTENAVVELPTIEVGEVQAADIEAVVMGLDHVTQGRWHADGILGMDFLKQFDVRLDFKAKELSFYPAATDRSSCAACPVAEEGIGFETISSGFIVVPATVNSQPVSALLDTGSGHSGLNTSAATAMGVTLPDMPAGSMAGHGFGLETGPLLLRETKLAERAALRVMDHPVMQALGLADRPSMLLGTDQLEGKVLTICYGLETLFLQ